MTIIIFFVKFQERFETISQILTFFSKLCKNFQFKPEKI